MNCKGDLIEDLSITIIVMDNFIICIMAIKIIIMEKNADFR